MPTFMQEVCRDSKPTAPPESLADTLLDRLRAADAAMLRKSFAWIDANDLWRDVLDVSALCNQVYLRWPAFVRMFAGPGRGVKATGDVYSVAVDGFTVYAHKPSDKKPPEVLDVTL